MRALTLLGGVAVLLASPALSQTGLPAPSQPPRCDTQCVRGNADRAVGACAPRIEAEAPGDYEWITRPYGGIFQEADTPERPDSAVVRYRGDSIRFMSPGKEWVRAIYECGFDAAAGQVAYVRVRLGVLGKKSAVPALPPQARASAPGPTAQAARPAPAASPNTGGVNVKLIGEPSVVDIRQIPPGAKPPPAPPAPAPAVAPNG